MHGALSIYVDAFNETEYSCPVPVEYLLLLR